MQVIRSPNNVTMHIIKPMASDHPKKFTRTVLFSLHIPIILCFNVLFAHGNDVETSLQTVRTWVNNDLMVSEIHEVTAENISGACVVLLRNGDLLGYGEAFGDPFSALRSHMGHKSA